jgi:RNA polymerase sigma-70 factor, ECF subfamily
MTGSLHDAEDLVQETFLKAWRSFDSFEGRGSFKAWLFMIATRVCLDAIDQQKTRRRMLPEEESSPATGMPKGAPPMDAAWLEPYPDAELDNITDSAPNPEIRYEQREAVRLAFIAAIQHLPPRRRAILLMIDVLGWSSAETASLVGGSAAAVNSALQRARTTLARLHPEGRSEQRVAASDDQSILLDRYVQAWEAKDLDGFIALLKEDAVYAMPPWREWYLGRESIRRFFGTVWLQYGRFRLFPTGANEQPAFALYTQDKSDGKLLAHSLHLLSIDSDLISQITLFVRPMGPDLFPAFGFPLVLDA